MNKRVLEVHGRRGVQEFGRTGWFQMFLLNGRLESNSVCASYLRDRLKVFVDSIHELTKSFAILCNPLKFLDEVSFTGFNLNENRQFKYFSLDGLAWQQLLLVGAILNIMYSHDLNCHFCPIIANFMFYQTHSLRPSISFELKFSKIVDCLLSKIWTWLFISADVEKEDSIYSFYQKITIRSEITISQNEVVHYLERHMDPST